jgi:hypothetical protein
MKRIVESFDEFHTNTFTGKEVADHVKSITPEESDIPDFFIDEYILPNDGWKIQNLKIEDLLKSDPHLKEYIDSGENRYESADSDYGDYVPYPEEVEEYIVVYNNEGLDGYSRISELVRQNETTVTAYVLNK